MIPGSPVLKAPGGEEGEAPSPQQIHGIMVVLLSKQSGAEVLI